MAALLPAATALAAFRAEGIHVVELPGWQSHNRDPGRTPLTPHGIVNHHTGSQVSDADALTYAAGVLWSGRAGLPGPLCHAGGAPDGRLIMVGWGRTNHAGGGDQAVLSAVIASQVSMTAEMRPTKGEGDPGAADGNAAFYGLEIMFSGSQAMTTEQYHTAVRFDAALCRAHGWTGASVIAHREWSHYKPDPGVTWMPNVRRDVNACLALPPGAWHPETSSNPPTPVQEDDHMSQADVEQLFSRLTEFLQPTVARVSAIDARLGGLDHVVRDTYNNAAWAYREALRANAQVAAALKLLSAQHGVSVDDIERAVAQALADSVRVTGTLTVEPTTPPAGT